MTSSSPLTGNEIAIVGVALRVPGARDVETFWRNLCEGRESIARFSVEEARAAGAPEAWLADPAHVRAGGALEGVEDFDAAYFGLTPREAELMDPQHRHVLELAVEALEDAGLDPARAPGAIGAFLGAGLPSYLLGHLAPRPEVVASAGHFPLMIANDKDFLATRVAHALDLRGPAMTVQTACSTSLVAVHQACASLLAGECDLALAGGVSINTRQAAGFLYQPGGIGSPDGHCRAFDARAAGTVGGSGAGVVVLKRLSDVASGERVLAVIKGTAVNNDGGTKASFTAPSAEGQARVISEALAVSGVEARTVGYVEAHGTGTALGDPIEVAGLTAAYRASTPAVGYCALGSVKTNLGHLDAAAGVVGLIKAALCVSRGVIVPSLHFEQPNPRLGLESSPFYVASERREWPEPAGHPRRAGVSSFGIGGTNAHAVLEAWSPEPEAEAVSEGPEVLVLSAKTPEALEAMSDRLAAHLKGADLSLAEVAHTLVVGRAAHPYRRAIAVRTREAAITELEAPAPPTRAGRPAVAFLFPGQGAQRPEMGRGLYASEPAYREAFDRCAELLKPLLGLDLREVLYGRAPASAEALRRTELAQPAIFAVSYATARALMARGAEPALLLGHSVGEFVAATLAGVFTLADALAIVAERGRLIQACPEGRMLAVALDAEALVPLLPEGCAVAALNAPGRVVVAGPAEGIAALEATLAARGVACKSLQTSHAFHSPMLAPAAAALTAFVAARPRKAPELAILSNVTGAYLTPEEAVDPAYWGRHLLAPVRFADGVGTVLARAGSVAVEVGPEAGLPRLVKAQAPEREAFPALQEADEALAFERALGRLWALGAAVRPRASGHRLVALPPYPFARARHWIDPPTAASAGRATVAGSLAAGAAVLPGSGAPVAVAGSAGSSGAEPPERWLHGQAWLPLSRPGAAYVPASTLVYARPGDPLVAALAASGAALHVAHPAEAFGREPDGTWRVRPEEPADHRRVWEALAGESAAPGRVLVAWGDPAAPETNALALMALLRAAAEGAGSALEVTVVAPGVFAPGPGERPLPGLATLLGPARCAPLEEERLQVRVIDPGEATPEVWLAELSAPGPSEVAWRGGRRWTPGWTGVEAPAPGGAWRAGGTYLVTGGHGALAIALTERLASAGARVALVVRPGVPTLGADVSPQASGPGAELPSEPLASDEPSRRRVVAEARIRALTAGGATVATFEADASDQAALEAVIAAAEARFGPLDGVFHFAGVAGGGLLRFREPEAARGVLRPKVSGAAALVAALGERSLDFLALASSVTASVGAPGQADYSAANAYLDALALAAPGALNAVALALAPWRGAGMAAQTALPDALAERREEALAHAMEPEFALDALERALGAGLPWLAVSPASPAALAAEAAAWRTRRVPGPAADGDAAPRTPTERAIAEIWCELLGLPAVGRHDHFFDLGGHSLTAVSLLARLEALAGRKLPVERLLHGGTIAELAAILDAEAPLESRPGADPCLVTLAEGEGRPQFWVHPSGGAVLCYAELVRALGPGRPRHALMAPGLLGEPPPTEIPALASRYVAAIRAVSPEGPYDLAGWSLGGVIAFEMARQLEAAGQRVSRVAVLDNPAPVPEHKPEALPIEQLVAMFAADLAAITGVALALEGEGPAELRLEAALAQAEADGRLADLGGASELRRRFAVFRGHLEAALAYAPEPYGGAVTLFRASAREPGADPTLGWQSLCRQPVTAVEVPGDHYTILTRPHVTTFAEALSAAERMPF